MKKIYYSVRSSLKRLFDRIRNEDLKQNLMLALPFWVASLFTGLIAVAYTKMFTWAEEGAHAIFSTYRWSFFLITPVCFLLAWWLVKKFAPFSRGSGIPQVMAAVDIISPANLNKVNKLLSLRVILIKIASSLVMVFGGGAIGREGPTIQIAGSIFRLVNKWLPAWWPKINKKNMILTGSAAGLAAAFNTPLGGIVFAVEELAKTHINYFKTALFTAVIVAGLTAQGLLGPYLYLG
ncbi:MAG: chloride channel protein, partial [Sphingobacteriales bacterium 12-47-4]